MVTINQVQSGLARFIDNELLARVNGWQKWMFGAGAGIALSKTARIFDSLRNNPVIKMLEVIDENGDIDIDIIHDELVKQARKSGAITIDVPGLGSYVIKEADVNKLVEYIKAD